MPLWLLRPRKENAEWRQYDCADGFVVRARSAAAARKIAAQKGEHGDEGADVWTDPHETACTELRPDGNAGVILRDYRAG